MILLIGPGGCGFSFLAWSIVFLRGYDSYQKIDGSIVQVPSDPITAKNNAHGFDRDHLTDLSNQDLHQITRGSSDQIVYVVPSSQDLLDRTTRVNCKKIFFCGAGYEKEILSRQLTKIRSKSELIRHLDTRWSIEQYAPVLMKQARRFVCVTPNTAPNSLIIDYKTMFLHLENTIDDTMRWCGFDIDPTQRQPWLEIYCKWRNTNINDISGALQKFNKRIDYATEKNIAKFLYAWWKAT